MLARICQALAKMEIDLGEQVGFFNREAKELEASRLYERTTYDIEMIRELGHCPGIENYSRYFDGREPGMRRLCYPARSSVLLLLSWTSSCV